MRFLAAVLLCPTLACAPAAAAPLPAAEFAPAPAAALPTAAASAPASPAAPSAPAASGLVPSAPVPDLRLWSPDPAARAPVADDLAARADPASYALLAAMLQRDHDPRVRGAAATAMAGTRHVSFLPLLAFAAAHDIDPGVRAAAAAAHARLAPFTKSPGTATWLAVLCPGCGHFYLGRPAEGLALLGSTAALLGAGAGLMAGAGLPEGEAGDDEPSAFPRFSKPRGAVGFPLLMAGQNLWFYNIFAAYRDARRLRGDEGYAQPVSDETLLDLSVAPFRPRVWARPWLWAGLPALAAGVVGLSLAFDDGGTSGGRRSLFDGGGVRFLGRRYGTAAGFALGELYYAALFETVAIGEESLFRGVVQPGLSEAFGPRAGWIGASLLFGGIHVFNFTGGDATLREAAVALPFITAVGAYFGYVSMKTEGKLETSVALHFWYDVLLATAFFVADPDRQPFAVRVSLPW